MPLIPDISSPKRSTAQKAKNKPDAHAAVNKGATKKNSPPLLARFFSVISRGCSLIARRRKPLVWAGILFLLFLVVHAVQARRLYTTAQGTKAEFDFTLKSIEQAKYDEAAIHLENASEYLNRAKGISSTLFLVKWLPVVRTQFSVIDTLIDVGSAVTEAGQDILPLVSEISEAVGSNDVTVETISAQQRRDLLQTIAESNDELNNAQEALEQSVMKLDYLPRKGLVGPLEDMVLLLDTNLPTMKTTVNKGLPFLTVAPTILGYPDEQTYLFLLQNNTELRPTGGFIGTYGILRLKDGDIQEFKTDDIYNLDNPMKDELFITPPGPLNWYLGSTQWLMRDSNWHPDFVISAQKAEEFYHLEQGPVETIDGVIAVTPVLIHDLLGVTGSITLDGDEYTAENLTEKLQYQVEVAFEEEGESDSSRKVVIGKLANQIMDRILRLPKSEWGKLTEILLRNLEQKHVMIYSKNEGVQTLIRDIGWDGALVQTESDYLMVVDANLAALKTDRVMQKTIEYTVRPVGNELIADLVLRYYNDGQFDFFTTRYRTYTRIYVPAGSEVISSSGFLTNDRYLGGESTVATVEFDSSVNKTVIAGFISVEPKNEEVISVQYKLPSALAQQYSLYVQKQPGTSNVTLSATIETKQKIRSSSPLDGLTQTGNNEVHLEAPLLTDHVVQLNF